MVRNDLNAVSRWITRGAFEHPHDLLEAMMARFQLTPIQGQHMIERLIDAQWLTSIEENDMLHYQPGLLRQMVETYELKDLFEDAAWAEDFGPYFAIPANVQRIINHAFCELVNNAIDHSQGHYVTVSLRQTASHIQLLVSDDGIGLFEKIRQHFSIRDPQQALFELSKGKMTSQPQRHCGHGLFFITRLADVLDLQANGKAFQRCTWEGAKWIKSRAVGNPGSSIYASFALDFAQTLDQVLQQFSLDQQSYLFERTIVQVPLLMGDSWGLESRSQARRVVERLQEFKQAEIDFSGVDSIGHSFADELMRVQANENPDAQWTPVHASSNVEKMLNSIRVLAQPFK
jgi:anti-sigma regulatory factor (Ser/Thr protein kinase)